MARGPFRDTWQVSSMLKMGRAYLKRLPSTLVHDPAEAAKLFRDGVRLWDDPECHYALAQMLIANETYTLSPDAPYPLHHPCCCHVAYLSTTSCRPPACILDGSYVEAGSTGTEAFVLHAGVEPGTYEEHLAMAVRHFESAAMYGHAFAAYNLGVAHLHAHGVAAADPHLAAAWFQASGLPEALHAVALYYDALEEGGRTEVTADGVPFGRYWHERARRMGFGASYRTGARVLTGTGGAQGVSLHSAWPRMATYEEAKMACRD